MSECLRKGDLVNFFTTFAVWQEEYARKNPGIVLQFKPSSRDKNHTSAGSADVLWADGSATSEHAVYLQKVKLVKEERKDGW